MSSIKKKKVWYHRVYKIWFFKCRFREGGLLQPCCFPAPFVEPLKVEEKNTICLGNKGEEEVLS